MLHLKVAPTIAAAIVLLGVGVWIFLGGSKAPPDTRKITVLALSSTGRWLAAGTSAGLIRIWEEGRTLPLQEIRESHGALNDLRFSPDERQLAIANGNLSLVTMDRPGRIDVVRDDDANYGNARFSADGREVLVITGQSLLEVIEIATRRTTLKACCSSIYGEVAFSPDDAFIFNAGHHPSVWDARSGRLVTRLTSARAFHAFGPIAFDIPRNLVYMGSQDGRVYAWDMNTRQLRTISQAQTGYVNTISVVGKTGWIVYSAFGGVVQMWNPGTGEQRQVVNARTTSNLLFDASNNLVLLGTDKGEVEAWDIIRGKIQRRVALP
jgi:hypothetical protein